MFYEVLQLDLTLPPLVSSSLLSCHCLLAVRPVVRCYYWSDVRPVVHCQLTERPVGRCSLTVRRLSTPPCAVHWVRPRCLLAGGSLWVETGSDNSER
jgi:hypothetical protein